MAIKSGVFIQASSHIRLWNFNSLIKDVLIFPHGAEAPPKLFLDD